MSKTGNRWFIVVAALMLALTALPASGGTSFAQAGCANFSETGKAVCGKFLTYWQSHGALAQQGYPISNEMQEVSDTDGRTYTVQYFERAIFELHPENQPPYDVLLSLLGNFLYRQKYSGNAPGQQASNVAGSRLFPETGKRLGGLFLQYWNTHGALAQQGFPISDEFTEVSDLDGKTYRVQYFERAVFEYHPENQPPYNVLLSQLGKFRYQAKYVAGGGPPPPPTPTRVSGGNPPPPAGCDVSGNRNGASDRTTVRAGESLKIVATGFTPGEPISYWITLPTGDVIGTANPVPPEYISGAAPGVVGPFEFQTQASFAQVPGRWAITFEGAYSHNQAIIYFCITP